MHTCTVSAIECGPLMAQNFQRLIVTESSSTPRRVPQHAKVLVWQEAELLPTFMLPMVYVQHVLLAGIR